MLEAAVIVATVAMAWLPGAAATRLLRVGPSDRLARLAHEVAIGIAFWPLLFLLTTTIGVTWGAWGARVVVLALLLASFARRTRPRPPSRFEWAAVALLAIVAFTRWSHVRGVIWPLWVDSVHHTMIVRLLVEQGTLPASYAPFIAESTFFYHWGFHVFIAFIAWVTGVTDLPRLLLVAGQVLNAMTFLAVYAGAKALLRDRRAALLAGVLATLVSYFPAYYVSWGRYTQLAGLLLLPPLASAFWSLGRHPRVGRAIEVALLAGGLLLIHVRVATVFAVLAAILTIVLLVQRRFRGIAHIAVAAIAAVALASPWLVHLARVPQVRTLLAPPEEEQLRWETPNGVPADLVWAPHNVPLFMAATGGMFALLPLGEISTAWRVAGVALWLALIALLQRRRRQRGRPLARLVILAGWCLAVALLINLDRLGLPRVRLLPNSAAVIMLFLPLSIAAGQVLRFVAGRRATLATLLIAVIGAATMLRIINPVTNLVTAADRDALRWIRDSTPHDARFAVGVQPWIGGAYTGVDGGYWIPLVSGRASILPPGLYPWVMSDARADEATALLAAWDAAEGRGDVSFLGELRGRGVTHLYFGPRNDAPLRDELVAAGLRPVYSRGGAEIYPLP